MLKPSDGIEGVKDAVVEAVRSAGANPCPPIIVGVGIGGTAEKASELAKRQLLRDIGSVNDEGYLASFERDVLNRINALRIGAQGFNGNTTALSVHAAKYPTHISALPVAVCIQCSCVRKASVKI